MTNALEALRQHSVVVADTGDFEQIARHAPRDATTNPTLILKAAQQPRYAPLVAQVVQRHRHEPMDEIADRVLVRFGCEILRVVPGRVSTEVDARLAFDADATFERGRRLAQLYHAEGVPAQRVLVKVAATWEGIQAAARLERCGIATNLTLLFNLPQAVACARAGVTLISPFAGRILDWHRQAAGAQWDGAAHSGANDPGVQSVRQIYAYYKQAAIPTQIMAASFRSTAQVLALAGCDLLTLSPELMAQLAQSQAPVPRVLEPGRAGEVGMQPLRYDEAAFRFALNEDAMASAKLAEGLRGFAADAVRLEQQMLAA